MTDCDTPTMATKPSRACYRVYLDQTASSAMGEICEATELGQTELLTKIVRAGLQALVDDGCQIVLPLRYTVSRTKPSEK